MSAGPERKLAAIMLADIAGFSALMERDETSTFERVRALRERLVVPGVAEHRGRIIKTTGDGFLAEFPSATAALQCGIALQRQNHAQERELPADSRIHMRIGINVGDIIIDGDDVAGDGVVIASRLEPLAPLDGICVSATVREHIRQELGVEYHDLGDQRVKNIARPIRAYKIDLAGAGSVQSGPATSRGGQRRVAVSRRLLGSGFSALAVALVGIAAYVAYHRGVPASGQDLRMTFAVLPITAPSSDKEAAAFASALTDALVSRQASSPWSRAVSRESVEDALRKHSSTSDLGRALKVRYLVRGSVVHDGGRFATALSLIDAESGRTLGARDFQWPAQRPLIAHRTEIDNAIGGLAGYGYRIELEEARKKADADRDARDLIYLARDSWKNTKDSYETAMQLLRRALVLSPDDRLALLLLARINLCECRGDWSADPAVQERIGTEAVEKYLRRFPDDREMLTWKAYINELHDRWDDSLVLYDRMLEKSPGDPDLASSKATALLKLDRPKEALPLIEEVLVEKATAGNRATAASIHFRMGNYARSAELSQKAIAEMDSRELGDRMNPVVLVRAASESRLDQPVRAKAALDQFLALRPAVNTVTILRKWQDPRAELYGYQPFYEALRKVGFPE